MAKHVISLSQKCHSNILVLHAITLDRHIHDLVRKMVALMNAFKRENVVNYVLER